MSLTRNRQAALETTLNLENTITKSFKQKNENKNCSKKPHLKKCGSPTGNCSQTSISSTLKNKDLNKNHSLFAPHFNLVRRPIHSNNFHASRYNPIKMIKKDTTPILHFEWQKRLSQYNSSFLKC